MGYYYYTLLALFTLHLHLVVASSYGFLSNSSFIITYTSFPGTTTNLCHHVENGVLSSGIANNKFLCNPQVQETAVISTANYANAKNYFILESSTFQFDSIIEFYPDTQSTFFHQFQLVISSTEPRLQSWHPPTIFKWPTKIIANVSTAKWEDQVHGILTHRIAPEAKESIDISQTVYFQFEIESPEAKNNATGAFQSYWELYFINGYDNSNLVVQEVVRVNLTESQTSQSRNYPMRIIRRGDLRATTLIAVAPNSKNTETELNWVEDPPGSYTLVGGVSYEIIHDFQEQMNFTTRFIAGDWLSIFPNGTFRGITAELFRSRKVDIMIGQTVPIVLRARLLDYLQPTSTNALRAFVQQPPASSIRDIYTTPFQYPLWLALFAIWILIISSIRITIWILFRHGAVSPHDLIVEQESLIWALGTVAQQGWHKHPQSISLRSIVITGTLVGLVSYIAYAAQIVSVLSLEKVPIRSFSSLLRSSIPVYVSMDSITIAELIKSMRIGGTIHKVSAEHGVHLTFKAPNGFLIYSHLFHHERKQQNISDGKTCEVIHSFPVTRTPLPSAMSTPKRSPLREFFNRKIIGMKERGLASRHLKKFKDGSGLNCLRINARYRPELSLDDVSTSIAILTVGYILCITMLAGEIVKVHLEKKALLFS